MSSHRGRCVRNAPGFTVLLPRPRFLVLETCRALFEPIASAIVPGRRPGRGHLDSWSLALAMLCVCLVTSCDSVAPRPVGLPMVSPSMVTGDALAALDDQSHYRTTIVPIQKWLRFSVQRNPVG